MGLIPTVNSWFITGEADEGILTLCCWLWLGGAKTTEWLGFVGSAVTHYQAFSRDSLLSWGRSLGSGMKCGEPATLSLKGGIPCIASAGQRLQGNCLGFTALWGTQTWKPDLQLLDRRPCGMCDMCAPVAKLWSQCLWKDALHLTFTFFFFIKGHYEQWEKLWFIAQFHCCWL